MRFAYNLPALWPSTTRRAHSSETIRGIRRRLCLALAGLLMTWILICGFVLLALARGWRL